MKILLADDEPIARTMLEHWLTGWGYDVVAARDGQEALAALDADPKLQLAIVDWVMPGLDGLEVCRRIRAAAQEPYRYVMLVTARDNKEDIVRGLDAGADDYIVKPCNPLELKVRLRAGRRVIDLEDQVIQAREALRHEATHDSLSALLNRRAVLQQLDREHTRALRTSRGLTVLMVDFDRFKAINDSYGHDCGDAVLRECAERIRSTVRPYDFAGRIGGEEFLVVLPDCDSGEAFGVAERLRRGH